MLLNSLRLKGLQMWEMEGKRMEKLRNKRRRRRRKRLILIIPETSSREPSILVTGFGSDCAGLGKVIANWFSWWENKCNEPSHEMMVNSTRNTSHNENTELIWVIFYGSALSAHLTGSTISVTIRFLEGRIHLSFHWLTMKTSRSLVWTIGCIKKT